MSRLVTLDGIRGIAAAVVVVHHYLLLSPWIADAYLAPSPAELSGYDVAQRAILILLWQGPFAVAIFFVLSGLVLSRSLFSRRTNWPRFLSSRLARLYLPVVGAVAIAAVLAMAIPRRPAPGMSWWTLKHTDPVNWSSVINNLTLFRVDWLNSPLWTLQCEVAFSLLLPVYILLVRVARRVPWLLGTVFVVIIVMGALTTNGVALYMPLFGLGVLAAALPPDTLQKLREWRARRKAMGIIIALVVANIGWFSLWPEDRLSTALLRATTALGALALVIIASVAVGDSWARSAPFRWLGTRSFSLYLIHEPILVSSQFLDQSNRGPLLVASVVATALLTEVFYRLVEKPSHRLARWIGQPKPKKEPVPITITTPQGA